jgi:mannose-6-phosphate isomerase-like protein (cupin superfamily)
MDDVETIAMRARESGHPYLEILRVPTLSTGVYVLPAGAVDRQTPHREDEVYYVVRGRAHFAQSRSDRPVTGGDVLFVPGGEPHHFHSVTEELVLLVVFAPPETRSASGD